MAVTIQCDVCKLMLEQSDKSFHLEDFLASKPLKEIKNLLGITSEKTDVCTICADKIVGNLITTVKGLAKPPLPKRIEKKGEKDDATRAKRNKSRDLRIWLCRLVEEGTHTRKQICESLHGRYPNYKSPESLSPRVSDLISPSKAESITKGTQFEGKIAMVEASTQHIIWKKV